MVYLKKISCGCQVFQAFLELMRWQFPITYDLALKGHELKELLAVLRLKLLVDKEDFPTPHFFRAVVLGFSSDVQGLHGCAVDGLGCSCSVTVGMESMML